MSLVHNFCKDLSTPSINLGNLYHSLTVNAAELLSATEVVFVLVLGPEG
jgi:hypothetical protein